MVGLQSQEEVFKEIKTTSVVHNFIDKNEIIKKNLANLVPAVVLCPLTCSEVVLV